MMTSFRFSSGASLVFSNVYESVMVTIGSVQDQGGGRGVMVLLSSSNLFDFCFNDSLGRTGTVYCTLQHSNRACYVAATKNNSEETVFFDDPPPP
jgi:hypothetical protein